MGMLPPCSSEEESQWPPLSTRWCWRNALIQDVQDLGTRDELGGMAATHSLRFPTLLPCFSQANTQTQQGHIQKCPSLPSLRRHCWSLSLAFQSWLSLNVTKNRKKEVLWPEGEKNPCESYFMECPVPAWEGRDWKDTCTWRLEPSLLRACWLQGGCTTHHAVQNGTKFLERT